MPSLREPHFGIFPSNLYMRRENIYIYIYICGGYGQYLYIVWIFGTLSAYSFISCISNLTQCQEYFSTSYLANSCLLFRFQLKYHFLRKPSLGQGLCFLFCTAAYSFPVALLITTVKKITCVNLSFICAFFGRAASCRQRSWLPLYPRTWYSICHIQHTD